MNSKPTDYGFHCNGECWKDFGQHEGMQNYLPAEVFNNFAFATWATEDNLGIYEIPEFSEVHSVQDYINSEAVERYRDATSGLNLPGYEKYPTIFKFREKFFVFQGTHRLVAMKLNGETSYTGWFLDLDQ